MTIVDTLTGEVIDVVLTSTEARALTDDIRQTLTVGHDLIVRAFRGSAWSVLGYESWDAYCAGEFAEARMVRLDREQRREIVAEMRQAGMSAPAISAGLGVPRSTVRDDLAAQGGGSATLPPVTGTDGKTYAPPAPRPQPALDPAPRAGEEDVVATWTDDERDLLKRLHDGQTVVINMRSDGQPAVWAWAEKAGLAVRVDRKSIWGNPFLLDEDGSRDEICDLYAEVYYPHKPSLHAKVTDLAGKALGCWCAPARCHADHLADLAGRS